MSDELPHRAFPKIPRMLADTPGAGSRWIATEKIHGAQLVVATDGSQVRFGKRKAWLDDDEPFFGWQLLRHDLERAMACIGEQRARPGPVYLYGELFGGHYPHEQVEAVPALKPVQTGIWYAPSLHFAVFAMLELDEEGEPVFASHSELDALAAEAGLMTAPVLGRGTRQELARLPVRYPSTVPALLGLPELADNIAEGFVLTPDLAVPARLRPVVKYKIPEFDEGRFDESVAFDSGVHLSVPELLEWAARMINPARLASASSKVGEDPEAIVEEAVLDVWIDLESLFKRRMGGLNEADEAQLRSGLFTLARAVENPR